jgi:hypothetical protein
MSTDKYKEPKSIKAVLADVKEKIVPDVEEAEEATDNVEETSESTQEISPKEFFLIEYEYIDEEDEEDTIMLKAERDDIPDCWRGISDHEEKHGRVFDENNMRVSRLGNEVKILGYSVRIEELS